MAVVTGKESGRLIARHQQLSLGDLLGGPSTTIEITIHRKFESDEDEKAYHDYIYQLIDPGIVLDEYDDGDIVRITIEKVGKNINAGDRECQDDTGEKILTEQ